MSSMEIYIILLEGYVSSFYSKMQYNKYSIFLQQRSLDLANTNFIRLFHINYKIVLNCQHEVFKSVVDIWIRAGKTLQRHTFKSKFEIHYNSLTNIKIWQNNKATCIKQSKQTYRTKYLLDSICTYTKGRTLQSLTDLAVGIKCQSSNIETTIIV